MNIFGMTVLTASLGFHATTPTEFANGFEKALSLEDALGMRRRARLSAKRFTEEEFSKGWIRQMGKLVDLQPS
jgi:alpha-1,2-mannosyltransferase